MSNPEPHFETAANEPPAPNHPEGSSLDPPRAIDDAVNKSRPSAAGFRRFGLNRGDQIFVAFVVIVASLLMLAHWLRLSGWGLRPVEIERLEPQEHVFQVDVNRATWVEWAQLEGIGPALAQRIVADREQRGPFATIDDVERVPGIGPKRLEQLRPWLVINSPKTSQ